ncbi:MAG TPA: hypothetical protein VHZ24_20805 [Pirellulales bacterium]|jgi:hypothetical protein|nr:hypothetical protein [Pirellulales bacterium]
MATVRFTGNAQAVAQIETLTVGGTIEAGDLFIMTINGKSLVVVAPDTDASDTAAAIANAWCACTIAEFREAAAVATDATIALTAKTAGNPFLVSVGTVEADGTPADDQTFTQATTVPSAGPNDWSQPANWSNGSTPVSGDDVYLDQSDIDVLYGLDQHSVSLNSLQIAANFSGQVGLPDANELYVEYRDRTLRIGAANVVIGAGPGSGSQRLRLDTGDGATTVSVVNTGTPLDNDSPALLWIGSNAANVLDVSRGSVGVALAPGETAQVSAQVGSHSMNSDGDADVRFGPGVTFGGLKQNGGRVEINSDIELIEKTNGELTVSAGAITTLKNFGGTLFYNSSSALGIATIGGRGRLDFSQDLSPKTVGLCNLAAGAVLYDPLGVASPAFRTVDCALSDVRVTVGFDKTYTPS